MIKNETIKSVIAIGSSGALLEIECHLSNGLPAIVIVGLGSRAIDEAKERIRSAFANCDIQLPRKRITINLAPADIPKESTSLDIAISMAIMFAGPQSAANPWKDYIVIGEIGLDGRTRSVRGIIGMLLTAQKLGMNKCIIPTGNLSQAFLVPGIEIIAIDHLKDLREDKAVLLARHKHLKPKRFTSNATDSSKLTAIVGQIQAKRALEIAAAGGHNIFLSGPPGTGKSMLAKALPSLLPPLSNQEMLEITHLHSLASPHYDTLVTERPFRAPHHSSSHIAIVGGGSPIKPGEISLSHYGVLFLDEMPEFNRATLEALRQPLEDRYITISRARESARYPARLMLVATANPCPCGYFNASKTCLCTPGQIMRYRQRVSGPILDRIDLHVTVGPVKHSELMQGQSNKQLGDKVIEHIQDARVMQAKRHGSQEKLNVDMSAEELKRSAMLTDEALNILNTASKKLAISARSYMKLIKVARTIADLEKSPYIENCHVSEALQYRPSPPSL